MSDTITNYEIFEATCKSIEKFFDSSCHNCAGKSTWGHTDLYMGELCRSDMTYAESIGFSPLHDKAYFRLRLPAAARKPYLVATRSLGMKICANWFVGMIRVDELGAIYFQHDILLSDCADRANRLMHTLTDLVQDTADMDEIRAAVVECVAPSAELFQKMEYQLIHFAEQYGAQLSAAAQGIPYEEDGDDEDEDFNAKELREALELARRLGKNAGSNAPRGTSLGKDAALLARMAEIRRRTQKKLDEEAEAATADEAPDLCEGEE